VSAPVHAGLLLLGALCAVAAGLCFRARRTGGVYLLVGSWVLGTWGLTGLLFTLWRPALPLRTLLGFVALCAVELSTQRLANRLGGGGRHLSSA
jgi:hypothetical protein